MVILGLGTNLGNREANLRNAIEFLKNIGTIIRQSSIIETEAVGFASDNKFLNMAIAIDTKLSPIELLDATQEIEKKMGRKQKSVNGVYHDRLIDIDIIDYNGIILNTERLTLPHPKANERDFVKIPLSEIIR
ncbi:MAG: 2-amino-4-hydroxy-6-hydroxymethyldihydropteridine diphosphokinase [Paludibacteraceae bacterium]|nr:2-amino-4-hydroxy-6-hydroxymethyldihydropteridine diphosphokinase [Paludibacteraceae bacterium]